MKNSVKYVQCGFEIDLNSALQKEMELELNKKIAAQKRDFDKEIEAKEPNIKRIWKLWL